MITEGMARYRARIDVWMAARAAAGGKLTQAEEAKHAGDCDAIWRGLTDDEQDALDRESRQQDAPRPPHP